MTRDADQITRDEMRELMEDLTNGPPVVHVVICVYNDGNTRAFTFSTPEGMDDFIEYIHKAGEELDIRSYTFYDTLIDAYMDYDFIRYGVWH